MYRTYVKWCQIYDCPLLGFYSCLYLNWNEFGIIVNICNLTLKIFSEKKARNLFPRHYKRYLNPVSQPLVSNLEPKTAINKSSCPWKHFKQEISIIYQLAKYKSCRKLFSAFISFFRFFPYVESNANDALINVLQGNTFIFEVFVL